jgi:hypothetical protein
MRYLFIGLLLCSWLVSGCGSSSDLPEGIIPDTSMSQIILEFALIEAAYNTSVSDPSAVKFKPELFFESSLKEKGFTREQFIRSIHYYSMNSKALLKIYDRALEQLSEQQAKITSQ